MQKFAFIVILFLFVFAFSLPVFAAPGDIYSFAGIGIRGFSGDGGPAAAARFAAPYGIYADGEGNVYISDSQNHRIRKVDAQGNVNTVAGDGKAGFSGDGGKALLARIHSPAQLCMDPAGNLYFADSGNNRVRKVAPDGTITTVAGSGRRGYSGDGGPAPAASLSRPLGVAADSAGNLYIADTENNRVRKVEPTGIIRKYAGTGEAGYSGDGGPAISAGLASPMGLAVGAGDNLYIADYYNHRVRKVSPAGTVTTVAGTGAPGYSGDGGPAIFAGLYYPSGVAVGPKGEVYIADRYNQRVRAVDESGNINTVAGNGKRGRGGDGGPAISAGLSYPFSLALDKSGNIYIGDNNNYRVRMVQGPDYGLPVSTITYPANGAQVQATFTIRGTASGPAGVSAVEVSADGGSTWSGAAGTAEWTFDWTPPAPGMYIIISRATGSDGKTETVKSAVRMRVPDPEKAGVSLTPDKKSAIIGEPAAFSASAPGMASPVRYQFLRRGPDTGGLYIVVRDWSGSDTWSWKTTAANSGGNGVMVKARGADEPDELKKEIRFFVSRPTGSTVKVTALEPDIKSAAADEPVIWTAKAAGGTGRYEYQFMRKGPGTGGAHVVARDWSLLNTWTFVPTLKMSGPSSIKVNVRNSDGTGTASSKEYPKFEVTSGRREPHP